LFIHLSWVNEEDNSGGLISLSKCKTKLNRWRLHWGLIYFLPLRLDLRSDRSPCFLHSLTIRSVRSLICDFDHRALRPDLSLILVDLGQKFNCFDENSFANFARVSTRLASSQIALSTRSAVGLCALASLLVALSTRFVVVSVALTTQFVHCFPALT
jgi:hypothetical protein